MTLPSFDIGKKIKDLRLASDLTQEELAKRASLTKGFISQLESGKYQTSVSLESLCDILDAFGVSLKEFFDDSSGPNVVFRKDDRVPVEDTGAALFELLVPGSTNNMMDPILIELEPGQALEEREPHFGEHFGFVLKGAVTLDLNKKRYRVPKDSCFYFKSNQLYQIRNSGTKAAALLWVTTPPQM